MGYQWNWIWKIQDRVWSFRSGADDRSVSTEGELLDSCCDGFQKKMLPIPSQSGIVVGEPVVS